MRIVTTTCSNTEIVCALGCADMLVGVDEHSDYPPEVVSPLPRVGPDLGIDPLRVAALRPDLVLASLTVPGHEAVVEGLEAAGLPVLAPEPKSIDDVYENVIEIASALGVRKRGVRLARRMERQMHPVDLERNAARPSLLVQWWPKPVIAPGEESWAHDLIERAGGLNPLGGEAVKSRPLDDEEVAELRPDAFVLSWCGVEPQKVRPDVVFRNPAWSDLPALRERRVFCVPEAWLGRPSQRLVAGFSALRQIVDDVAGRSRAPEALRRPGFASSGATPRA